MSKKQAKKQQNAPVSREEGHSRTENQEQPEDDLQHISPEEISSPPHPGRISNEDSFASRMVNARRSSRIGHKALETQGLPDSRASDASPFKAATAPSRTPISASYSRPHIPSSKEKGGAPAPPLSPKQPGIPAYFKSLKSPTSTPLLSLSAFRQSPEMRDAFEALAAVIKNTSSQPPKDITSTGGAAATQLILPPETNFQNNPEGSLFSSATAELQHSVTAAVTQARGAHHESQPFSDPRLLPPTDPNPAFTQTEHEVLLENLQRQHSTDPAIELQIHLLQELIALNTEQRRLQALMRQQDMQLEHQAHLLMQYKGTSSQPVLLSSTSPKPTQERTTAPHVVPMLKNAVANQQTTNTGTRPHHLHDGYQNHVQDKQCQRTNFTHAPEHQDRRMQTRFNNDSYTFTTSATAADKTRPPQWLAVAQQQSQMAERIRLQRATKSAQEQMQAAQQAKLTDEAARRREIADAQDHTLILETQRRIEARQRRHPTNSDAAGLAPDSVLAQQQPHQQQPQILQPQRPTLRLAQRPSQHQSHLPQQPQISVQPRERKLTIRVKKSAQPSEAELLRQERRLARLMDDKEYLRHGSERCKDEVVSEDERQEILEELDAPQAAHLMFHPRAPVPRTKHGYLDTTFVARDSESPEHFDNVDESDEDGDNDQENDGDSSSTYRPPSNPSSMSRSRSPEHRPKRFSSAQWEEYQQLKRASTAPQQTPSQAQQPNSQLTYNISIAEPPEHGEWRDIQYLTTTFRDKHEKYVRRCKGGGHLSVWDCYTITQKECILKHLEDTDTSGGPVRDAAYLESLTDTQLYALLQGALGMEYELEVEKALKAIPFKGKVLEKSDWVSFHTAWTQVLKRVTSEGAVQPRRMAEIFRSSITDKFAREWLYARKHNTWTEAYDAIVAAIANPKWIKCYADDLAERPKQQQQLPPAASPQNPVKPPQQQHSASPKEHKKHDKVDEEQIAATPFDPLAFKTKAGKNVNPHFKLSLNDNTSNTPCSRCGKVHRFLADLCTALKTAEGETCPPISPEEFKRRMKARWDKGFYFSKALDAYKSPSPSDVAAAAAHASQKIGGKP